MKKIYFLGAKTIGYNCLRYLLDYSHQLDIEVSAVFTNSQANPKDFSNILALCQANHIAVYESIDQILELSAVDYLISVQYHQILRSKHLTKASIAAINLHMAPLPEYRGCNQFSWAIVNGDCEFGTTLHIMAEGIDNGDIIAEKRFAMPENCWVEDLYQLTAEQSYQLFAESIPHIISGDITAKPQQSYTDRKQSFHLRKDIESLKELDLNWSKEKITRHIRATLMPGFEGPYFLLDGKKIRLALSDDYSNNI